MKRIITRHEPPPIPDRNHDWTAMREDYEPGWGYIGHGKTEDEAINDLLIQERSYG